MFLNNTLIQRCWILTPVNNLKIDCTALSDFLNDSLEFGNFLVSIQGAFYSPGINQFNPICTFSPLQVHVCARGIMDFPQAHTLLVL